MQILSIEVLRAPDDMDQVNEFRFFLVAGNEDPTHSAGLIYPARANMAVRVGDTIETGGLRPFGRRECAGWRVVRVLFRH